MSDIKSIAQQLVDFCRQGQNLESINTLYAENIESIEAAEPQQGGQRIMQGLEAVRGKNQWWGENHEVHEANVEGPWPHGDDKFAVHFSYDVTNKPSGQRFKMDEIAVFTVEGGKIVREEFFYDM